MVRDVTPEGEFGRIYYCQPGLWREACRAGRSFGPVVPPGHPDEQACVTAFLGAPCPYWGGECTGTGNECPITYDPYFVIGGVNQNHPKNVEAGCRVETWWPGRGQPRRGEWWVATSHGRGYLTACDGTRTVCGKSPWVIAQ